MLGRQKPKPRVFNYIPRYYDQKNQQLIKDRFGDSRFAEAYLKKKAASDYENMSSENLSFADYRKHSNNYARKKLPVNMLFLLVMVMLLVLLTYLLTSETFGILYK